MQVRRNSLTKLPISVLLIGTLISISEAAPKQRQTRIQNTRQTQPAPITTTTAAPDAAAQPAVITTVSDVRGLNETSGGKALISYVVRHDVNSHIDPGSALPGARISNADYPDQFSGAHGDAAFAAAWLSPQSMIQFNPVSQLYENTYFFDAIENKDAFGVQEGAPMESGDHAEIAITNSTDDAPMTWAAPRGTANGQITWDYSTDSRNVTASYAGVAGDVDIIFVRADIVARGGDVDARGQELDLDPLVLDLPKIYMPGTAAAFTFSTFFPAAQYIKSMRIQAQPALGKLVLEASVEGYFPEAKEYTLPSGAQIKEWHMPIIGVIAIKPTSALVANASLAVPAGAQVVAGTTDQSQQLNVASGGRVIAATNGTIVTLPDDPNSQTTAPAPTTASATQSQLALTSAINHTTSALISFANADYSAVIDPDLRGSGVLAIRSLQRQATGTTLADVIAAPFVLINGTPVTLDRSKLVDLRVYPDFRWVSAQFTGYGETDLPSRTLTVFGSALRPGFTAQAVYDLGNQQYAFVKLLPGHFETTPLFVPLRVTVTSIATGARVSSAPVEYFEIPYSGPITYNGTTESNEFSAPLDALSPNDTLTLGQREFTGTAFSSNTNSDGQVTVVQAPGSLTALPQPGAAALDGKVAALYYVHAPGAARAPVGASVALVQLDSDFTPSANPKAIDDVCSSPVVTDGTTGDAPAENDIESAWFDVDDANLYASIRVANLPTAAPSGSTYSWALHWRNEHSTRYARAILDSSGNFSFEFGNYNLNSTLPSYSKSADVTGDYKVGADGIVRIWIPRTLLGYFDGDLLRDTSARSQVTTNGETVEMDQAPNNANPVSGSGGDYELQKCGSNATATLVSVVSRKTHGDGATFDVNLPLLQPLGIEPRSGGPTGDHTLVFRFLHNLTSADPPQITNGTATVASAAVDSNDPHNFIVNLTNVANAQSVDLSLINVVDSENNISSAVPVSFSVLIGDTNGDDFVDSADISKTKSQSGMTLTGANFREDLNSDGLIDSADIAFVKSKSGTAIPQH